jgi:hypothetical protein
VLFLTEHDAMKAYWGIGGIAPHIPNLCTRWRLHAPTALPLRKETLVPIG